MVVNTTKSGDDELSVNSIARGGSVESEKKDRAS